MMKNGNLSFYEIYPTSFYDSNGDGIGDIKGIIKKLDYVKSLGFKGIWFNPFFLSNFKDGGYDIIDFKKIDPKFGTNADAYRLIKECHKRGLLVIFDLVAGHMSWDSPYFKDSAKSKMNKNSSMFIWTDSAWTWDSDYAVIRGLYDRDGAFMVNFFVHQPALNYGFNKITRPWQQKTTDEGPKKTRDFIVDVMKFWCSKGVDGYRCDMADSLVKNDTDNKDATQECWRYMFGEVRKEYPNMIAVSEWSNPHQSLSGGFDMDFVLDHQSNFSYAFFRKGYEYESDGKMHGQPLFEKFDQELYDKAIKDLVYRIKEQEDKPGHYLAPISGNHDTFRIADSLKGDDLKLAYLFLFTMPGIPFVFAGDEGMQTTRRGYPSKDGGFQRTGARFVMNWDKSMKNHGFSKTDGPLYLPYNNKDKDIESQIKDVTSLLNLIKALNKLRDANEDLTKHDGFELLDKPLSYRRGKTLIAMNLKDEPMEIDLKPGLLELSIGSIEVKENKIILPKHAAIVYKER